MIFAKGTPGSSGGIIDLRTKKGLEYGMNGSWGLNYRQNRGDTIS